MVNWLLANFFAKPKSKPVARFDVITNFLVSKSANWVRLAHWPRRGALCGRSKGGDSMSHFPVKFAPAMQKGSMKCLGPLYFDAISSGGDVGGTGASGHRGPAAMGPTLGHDIF